jgi:phospholipid N-methyltransferase
MSTLFRESDGRLDPDRLRDWTNLRPKVDYADFMSVLFFKRFLKRPFQIASIVPSSKALVERVASKMDFSQARVIAEYGPGEGVHSREITRRMSADSHLLLFELDAAFSRDLQRQFAGDRRVHVIHGDAARLPDELEQRGFSHSDLLQKTYDALAPGGNFVIYQVTNELKQHATLFDCVESEYFLQNIPPMFITVFQKARVFGRRSLDLEFDRVSAKPRA